MNLLLEKKPGLFDNGISFPKNNQEALRMLTNPHSSGLPLVNSTRRNLSYTIQDVLDAKARKDTMGYKFSDGLPKKYLFQIAEMLNLDVTEKTSGSEMATLILRETQ